VDLCRRFPTDAILPIALVDDSMERELSDKEVRGAEGEVFLMFRTRLVQVPELDLERFRDTANRVASPSPLTCAGHLTAPSRYCGWPSPSGIVVTWMVCVPSSPSGR
jgi:hypothetical protein